MKPTTATKSVKDFFLKGKDNNKREYIRKLGQSRRSNIQAVAILESENIERRKLLIVRFMKMHQAKHVHFPVCILHFKKSLKVNYNYFLKGFQNQMTWAYNIVEKVTHT